MRKVIIIISALSILLINGCAVLEKPTIKKYGEIDKYQFVVIPTTKTLNSSAGGVIGNQYGVYGASQSNEISPSSLIEGLLLKKGIISIDNITPEIINKTLIVKYGESGKRDVMGGLGGYTLEVTIKIISAKNLEPVFLCTAEGQGSTEADDLREAIIRCLSEF